MGGWRRLRLGQEIKAVPTRGGSALKGHVNYCEVGGRPRNGPPSASEWHPKPLTGTIAEIPTELHDKYRPQGLPISTPSVPSSLPSIVARNIADVISLPAVPCGQCHDRNLLHPAAWWQHWSMLRRLSPRQAARTGVVSLPSPVTRISDRGNRRDRRADRPRQTQWRSRQKDGVPSSRSKGSGEIAEIP